MNLNNLAKLLGGAAPAAIDCKSKEKIYTLRNDGSQTAEGSDRQNQCMWISIFDFLKVYRNEHSFDNVIAVAVLTDPLFKTRSFNLEINFSF